MSMCLYLASGPERDMLGMARDSERMQQVIMGHVLGRMAAFGGVGALAGALPSEQAFEQQLKLMGRAAWRQGPLVWLMVQLMKGRMRKQMTQQRAILAATQTPANDAAPGPEVVDLHKSWHVLHYLFTGSAWEGPAPANTLLAGGREVGEDLGYGPARVVDAAATAAFARYLDTLSVAKLKARIDMKRMAELEIYCAANDDDDEGDVRASRGEIADDVEHYFPLLQQSVAAAAARKEALAIWMA